MLESIPCFNMFYWCTITHIMYLHLSYFFQQHKCKTCDIVPPPICVTKRRPDVSWPQPTNTWVHLVLVLEGWNYSNKIRKTEKWLCTAELLVSGHTFNEIELNCDHCLFSHNGLQVRFVLLSNYEDKNISTFCVWTSKNPLTDEAQKYFSTF